MDCGDIVDDGVMKKRDRLFRKYAKRMAFSKFVKSREKCDTNGDRAWTCCSENQYKEMRDFHRHVSQKHTAEIDQSTRDIVQNGSQDAKWKALTPHDKTDVAGEAEGQMDGTGDMTNGIHPWLPEFHQDKQSDGEGQVLLFYTYIDVENPAQICKWQQVLCSRLGLHGKVRIASEGLNGTVAGCSVATETYIKAVMAHPNFHHMALSDFKKSKGHKEIFPDGLKVGVYEEVVPMGISPKVLSYKEAGKLLSPEEFHEALSKYLKSESDDKDSTVFVDCRNFYESNIGKFHGALTPDIRKFSYWPEYVEANKDYYADKNIYMYCTGGIRCERGSAFFKHKGIGKEIYQLSGGIHKYLEKFPDGHFRGKLFVFDDRYSIHSNEDVISECRYCKKPWDHYAPCSSRHCHQLVLACDDCKGNGHTACCNECQNSSQNHREECECTRTRARIPVHAAKENKSESAFS